jgi:hypothetical protein
MNLLLATILTLAPFIIVGTLVYNEHNSRCSHDWEVVVSGKWETLLKCKKCGKLHKEFIIKGEKYDK